jgi:Lon protease-like protein
MSENIQIPMFPLTLLPVPGELVPLHIFEPRYKQLLQDAETSDFSFGIFCNHYLNQEKLGSLMKLESIIKRYPGGEADIIVRCIDNFKMDKLFRTFRSKLYPGGEVQQWHADLNELPGIELYEKFIEYQQKRNITTHISAFNIYQVAIELNLDLFDRYRFLNYSRDQRISFLRSQLKYQLHVLTQEEKSKDLYHLN